MEIILNYSCRSSRRCCQCNYSSNCNGQCLTVTWSPVNECISYYTVRSVVAVNTTDTSIVYQLELGKVYSFTVTGTDTAGRTGSESEAVTITMDGIH